MLASASPVLASAARGSGGRGQHGAVALRRSGVRESGVLQGGVLVARGTALEDDELGLEDVRQPFMDAFAADAGLLKAADRDAEGGAERVVADGAVDAGKLLVGGAIECVL